MGMISLELRDRLINDLREVERQTEDIFMVLAESLPALVHEMKRSLDESNAAISCLSHGQYANGCSDEMHIASLVDDTRNAIEDGARTFRDMSARDLERFQELQSAVAELESISQLIDRIRRDSEDMELVSLNAMTVALKAGTAGRAFSYITEELKRLASRTIALSEQISQDGNQLIESFRGLETSLDDARAFQENLIANFQDRIFSSFHEFQTGVESTLGGLQELQEESAQLRTPVNGMMEAIQLQDLIRQSIDHIILALEAIQPESSLPDDEAILDELAFVRQIPDLAEQLIEDVAQQIDNSVSTFMALVQEAEEKRTQLVNDQDAFIAGRVRHEGSHVSLDDVYTAASTVLKNLLSDLDRNRNKKEQLVQRSSSITSSVEELENQFRRFNSLVTRFRSIDIASRIEVAKQDVLRQMGSSAEQMTLLTRQIEKDVEESLEATRDFIRSIDGIITSHRQHVEEESAFITSFSATLRGHYEDLSRSREGVSQVVSGFSLFTDGFHRVFSQTRENGVRLEGLGRRIRALCQPLDEMKRDIERRFTAALEQRELTDWQLENDRLLEIINRFTIFAHKQRASELTGISVDEGVGAGDITLF